MMPYPIIIGVGFVLIYLTIQVVKSGRKTPTPTTTPTTKTKLKINWSLMGKVISKVIFAVLVTCGLLLWFKHEENKQAMILVVSKKNQVIKPVKEYVYGWTLPRGQYINGLNKVGPLPAEIVKLDEKNFWIDVMYDAYGKTEICRYRLTKVRDNHWSGKWRQDKPENSGTCEIKKEGEDLWLGQLTSYKDPGKIPMFTIKRK